MISRERHPWDSDRLPDAGFRPLSASKLRPAGFPSGADQTFHRDGDSRPPASAMAVREASTSPLDGAE
jgi:hypothetical protein